MEESHQEKKNNPPKLRAKLNGTKKSAVLQFGNQITHSQPDFQTEIGLFKGFEKKFIDFANPNTIQQEPFQLTFHNSSRQ